MDPLYKVPCVVCVCICYSITSLGISSFREKHGYTPWMHESSVAATLGLILGGAIKYYSGEAIQFDSDTFFYLVLPPIIFSAGISLDKESFFNNIGTMKISLCSISNCDPQDCLPHCLQG
jgi:NhaP-type Na+/H+ or K+/H+ antiporter